MKITLKFLVGSAVKFCIFLLGIESHFPNRKVLKRRLY